MSRMSELHADLGTIHKILLGQRKVAHEQLIGLRDRKQFMGTNHLVSTIECIDNLLLEIEAAGVVWPDNVVDLQVNTVTPP